MSMDKINQYELDILDTVSVLVKTNHYLQALVILYAAIDTLAWSNLSTGDVTKSNFVTWVTTYIDPTRFGCTADDLYAARCGLLHSGAAESRMSREGQASELWYVTSPNSVAILEDSIRNKGANAKVVIVTDLIDAFFAGFQKFSDELAVQDQRRSEVTERIKPWLTFVPTALVTQND
jgi:hypothetical protein